MCVFSVSLLALIWNELVLIVVVDLCVVFSADQPDAKKAKVDEETVYNLAEIAEGNITSVRPVSEITSLIKNTKY